jgi:hypothetical protein
MKTGISACTLAQKPLTCLCEVPVPFVWAKACRSSSQVKVKEVDPGKDQMAISNSVKSCNTKLLQKTFT